MSTAKNDNKQAGAVRISVFGMIERMIVGEQEMPASIAPEGFQAQQRFVSALAPVLAWPPEAALGLPTCRSIAPSPRTNAQAA